MKIILVFLFIFFIFYSTGCTSSYCHINKAIDTLDTVFVEQWNNGIKNTQSNFQEISDYLAKDITTCGNRLNTQLCTIYEPVNFSNTGKRLNYISNYFVDHWQSSMKNTPNNIKTLAQCLCLCSDDDEE